jgi:hypothetical protein
MKKAMLGLAGSTLSAMLVAMALAAPPAHADMQGKPEKSPSQRIAGVWDAKVVITDCSSGNPIGLPFDALGVFERDGTFHDTNANNPTMMVRSDALGYWKHVRGNKYRFAFKIFNFDVSGAYLGYQIVRHDLVLARNGKSYTSEGGAEFYNPDGTPRPPVRGCSETTATRFK